MSASTKLSAAEISAAMLIEEVRQAPGIPTAWLPVSFVMAHVQIESGFDPSIKASDFATTGSVGLMQVAAPTLGDIKRDYPAAANTLALSQTDPLASICAGMLYLRTCYNYLLPIFKAPLAYRHVCVAYNEGPGNAGKGIADAAYYIKWLSAQQKFAFLDAPAMTV